MNSDEDDDITRLERLPIYRKGKEILDMVIKIGDLIPENDEYLKDIKACLRHFLLLTPHTSHLTPSFSESCAVLPFNFIQYFRPLPKLSRV
jgi:hypothetical protein